VVLTSIAARVGYTVQVSDNSFLEEVPFPDPAAISAVLGDKVRWYRGIIEAASGFQQDWKHYGKKYGWKLKVHEDAKALFELTVTTADVQINLAARESEVQALRSDPAAAAYLAKILPEGRSKAGWGIRIVVYDEGAYEKALFLIKKLAEIRRAG
jgi:hypothetical protein